MKNLLVVCEGNICRSPMAQGLLAARLPEATVASAGLGALVAAPADETAVRLMREQGIDITGHRATQITRQSCLQADIVLVMESSQRKRIETLYPQVRGRVFRLTERLGQDVPDPYRKSEEAFRTALQLIEQGVDDWLARIQRL